MVDNQEKELEKEWRQSQKRISDKELVDIFGKKTIKEVVLDKISEVISVYKERLDRKKRLEKTSKKTENLKDFTSEFFKIWAEVVDKTELQPLRKKIRWWISLYRLTSPGLNNNPVEDPLVSVEEIKQRVQLKDVVEQYTKLFPMGRNYRGRCPFPDHDDKNPSFFIYEENQQYHCYGCGRHGDVINFVMEIENLDFKIALKKLKNC